MEEIDFFRKKPNPVANPSLIALSSENYSESAITMVLVGGINTLCCMLLVCSRYIMKQRGTCLKQRRPPFYVHEQLLSIVSVLGDAYELKIFVEQWYHWEFR